MQVSFGLCSLILGKSSSVFDKLLSFGVSLGMNSNPDKSIFPATYFYTI